MIEILSVSFHASLVILFVSLWKVYIIQNGIRVQAKVQLIISLIASNCYENNANIFF